MAHRDNDMPEYLRSAQLIEEAEQTLRAIQHGAVDAFVVEESDGHHVYTLEGSDLPYSTLVERMQQGAAILDSAGCIIYCNLSLAGLLGMPREDVIGRYLQDFVDPGDHLSYQKLLRESKTGSSEGEVYLPFADGSSRSASFSFSLLSREKTATGVLITDLTPQKQQMEFASRLQNMQDEERRRIARELHDSVGQLLAAIGMNMEILRAQTDKLDAKGQQAFNDNAMMVEQVSSEIRTISHLLHPPLLDLAGLASALRWYVDGFSARSNIKVDVEIPETLGRLPAEMEIAIFRMVQECLTNIHRHSGSPTATISLSQEGERVTVQVRDMGKGIPLEKQRDLIEAGRGGVGLGGMRERLRQLGGTLEIKSGDNGTTILATLLLT
jgi:PAS domain S-box-containing protein